MITIKVSTPSGGLHYYFRFDPKFKNCTREYGIDVPAMVCTGRRYEIINDADEMDYPPQELYDLLYKNENKKQDNNKNKVKNECVDLDFDCIDHKYYELINLLPDKYFNDYDKWMKPAYALYNAVDCPKNQGLNTFCRLLSERSTGYNEKEALRVWNLNETQTPETPITFGTIAMIAGGTNPEKYNDWKNKYQSTSNDKTPSTDFLDMMKDRVCELVGGIYKREYGTGRVYKRVKSYYYKREYDDPQLFLNHIFKDDDQFSRLKKSQLSDIINYIQKIQDKDFPFIELDYNYLGFQNGIYNLKTAEFTSEGDIDDMTNIQVRKCIDTPFELTETPLLDDYLNFQFADKDGVIEFIYFMCGRALTKIEDRFDFMLFLYGQSGSGKSELLELIKYSYGVNQVSNLKSSFEKTFGLSAVAKSQIFVSDDMPINVANVFSKDNFLSMIT